MPEPLRGSWHPRVFKRSSGRIEFYFRDEYPTVFEYNSLGLAAAVNNACFDAISLAIEPLSRREKQRIRSIWSFLVDNRVSCKPLGASIASQAMNLVSFAGARYAFKPNFRNSLNDLIVFATALQHCLEVTTADKLLARSLPNMLALVQSRPTMLFGSPLQALKGQNLGQSRHIRTADGLWLVP